MSSDIVSKIINSVQNALSELNLEIDSDVMLERPADESHGDYSTNIAMQLASQLKKNPREIAQQLVDTIELPEEVESVEIAGPGFVNFKLKNNVYGDVVVQILDKNDEFGKGDSKKNKTVLIEHTSPNPNKALHLGHLKNNVTGLSISYLLEAIGVTVFRDAIDNNRGIAIARLMWGYLKYARKDGDTSKTDIEYWFNHQNEWNTPEEAGVNPGMFVDELYTKGSEDFKNHEDVEQKVRQMVIDWEAEDKKNWDLWKLTQEWVWVGYKQSLKRINGWKFDTIWHEHEHYKEGKSYVQEGLNKGIFKKTEDGAIVSDLKDEFGLTDTILIKRDGTSLYITQDIALTDLKRKKFHPDELYWIIGPEQSLAMKQMFAVCSQLGIGNYEDYHHISYGFILVKDENGNPKKMSSRDGTQIYVDQLIDKAKMAIINMISSENLKDKESVAETVAIGAIKYSLLKVSRTQDMVFDFDETISLEGNSGPYLLYTYARAQSVLSASDDDWKHADIQLNDELELSIAKWLARFPETVQKAAEEYAPHYICEYTFELGQRFNKFYNSLPIAKEEDEDKRNSRLALTAATAQVIQNALKLLGIETVERM